VNVSVKHSSILLYGINTTFKGFVIRVLDVFIHFLFAVKMQNSKHFEVDIFYIFIVNFLICFVTLSFPLVGVGFEPTI
jgi:hypothetical protein